MDSFTFLLFVLPAGIILLMFVAYLVLGAEDELAAVITDRVTGEF